jgi:hypothetical protein
MKTFLKKFFFGILFLVLTFYIKNSDIAYYILNFLNLNNTEFNLYFTAGLVALMFRLFLITILEFFFNIDSEYIMYSNNYNDSYSSSFSEEAKKFILNKNSDSGNDKSYPLSSNNSVSPSNPSSSNNPSISPSNPSASNDPVSSSIRSTASSTWYTEASSSKDESSWKPLQGKGIISDSDYEWESDDSNSRIEHGYSSDDSYNGQESQASKFINSINFESRVKKASIEELSEVLVTIDQAKLLYENSTVPSKVEQIALLNKKEALCVAEIEQKLIERENSSEGKGKGKEIENLSEDKGKGKEIAK